MRVFAPRNKKENAKEPSDSDKFIYFNKNRADLIQDDRCIRANITLFSLEKKKQMNYKSLENH